MQVYERCMYIELSDLHESASLACYSDMLCPVGVTTETEPLRYSSPAWYWDQDGEAWIPSHIDEKSSRSCQVNLRQKSHIVTFSCFI